VQEKRQGGNEAADHKGQANQGALLPRWTDGRALHDVELVVYERSQLAFLIGGKLPDDPFEQLPLQALVAINVA
jgi:hypothetical protein